MVAKEHKASENFWYKKREEIPKDILIWDEVEIKNHYPNCICSPCFGEMTNATC